MGDIFKDLNLKCFLGLLFNQSVCLNSVYESIEKTYGSIDSYSDIFPFTHTQYYEKEMGTHLQKQFLSIKTLVTPSEFSKIKKLSNDIEINFSINNSRNINIDPGFLSPHNVLLLSTKNFSHRIPVGNGIYAELTLLFKNKQFQTVDWTYPDFKFKEYQSYLLKLRKQYLTEIQ